MSEIAGKVLFMNGIPKIIDVKPLDNMTILVTFDNNIMKNYNLKKLINKYPHKNGKLAMIYTICSALVGYISLTLYGALR